MSERSQVYSSCFWRQRFERVWGSEVISRAASTTEWTSKSVPYASKTKARGAAIATGSQPVPGTAALERRSPGRRRGRVGRPGRREAGLVDAEAQDRPGVAERQAPRL